MKNKAASIAIATLVVGLTTAIILPSFVSMTFTSPVLSASAQVARPAYTNVTNAFVLPLVPNVFTGGILTAGNITQVPDAYINSTLAFGYVWRDNSTNAVLAMIHRNATLDSASTNAWHPHIAKFSATTACSGVGLGLQVTSLTSPSATQAGLAITQNGMKLWVNSTAVTPDTFRTAISFKLLQPTQGVLCVAPP